MTEKELIQLRGEAMFASIMVTALVSSMRPLDRVVETIDHALLICEGQIAKAGAPKAALDHTRQLLQQLYKDTIDIQRVIALQETKPPTGE